MALTTVAVGMTSKFTVEVIGTRLVARNSEGVFRRQTSELEYRGFP